MRGRRTSLSVTALSSRGVDSSLVDSSLAAASLLSRLQKSSHAEDEDETLFLQHLSSSGLRVAEMWHVLLNAVALLFCGPGTSRGDSPICGRP